MTDEIDDHWDSSDEADDKTRIQLPNRSISVNSPEDDLIGSGDDATAFRKPKDPGISRDHDRETAKTERAPEQALKNLKSRIQPTKVSKDPTKAVISAPVASKSRLQTQDTLKNRFVLGRVLGAGGMGVVYKAKDLLKVEAKDRDPFVAIKVLGEEFKSHPEAFIALQRESRKTQKIAHPNIVNVYDFDKDGDTVFMTMEFLDGSPLDKLIKKYKTTHIPRDQAWEVLEGVCSALAYAHEQNIIHADLKPGNIFVTHNNVAKVFDFGIARAVAKAEHSDSTSDIEDKTIFDAGNLGALTPAYASLEMLEGESPDIRDDVYALGCIAYEMLTGKHPYQRKNALEAKKLGLKPQRIANITKRQWRAIEKALAFDRKDRIASARDFWFLLSSEQSTPFRTWFAAIAITTLIGLFAYQSLFKVAPVIQPTISAEDVASEAELKVRIEIAEATLNQLLGKPLFDERWESELYQALITFTEFVGIEDPRVLDSTKRAYELYVQKIQDEIEQKKYPQARAHILNAHRYTSDSATLDQFEQLIAQMLEAAEKVRLAELQKATARNEQTQIENEQSRIEERKRKAYDMALANINEQLKCINSLNMDNFTIAVTELRKIDAALYTKAEPNIIKGLVSCIKKVARNFPPRAETARVAALTLFNNNKLLQGLTIAEKDPCREGLAGQGARGKRSICRDSLKNGSKGPQLIVIPADGKSPIFAIGKYEVSYSDMNVYCVATKTCKPSGLSNEVLPVTNISVQQAKDYLLWLSQETGKIYRLPTAKEWGFAAKAQGNTLYSNRNCKLNSRGIQKGGALVSAEVGQQNDWGVVNHIGNAQEWVIDQTNNLLVAGGSYNTQMDECTADWKQSSSGTPELETGFRVFREMKKK